MNKQVVSDMAVRIVAELHLSIKNLETQNSDSKDFHTVSAWDVRKALEAAFDIGFRAASGNVNTTESRFRIGLGADHQQ